MQGKHRHHARHHAAEEEEIVNDNAASIISKVWSCCHTLRDDGVEILTSQGHRLLVEKNAGIDSGFAAETLL